MPASRAPALGEPSRGLSRRQPGDGSRWDGALAARRRGGGEASLAGCARQRERPAGILPATAAASCDSRPSRCGDVLLARLSCEHAGISRGRSSVPKAQCEADGSERASRARPARSRYRGGHRRRRSGTPGAPLPHPVRGGQPQPASPSVELPWSAAPASIFDPPEAAIAAPRSLPDAPAHRRPERRRTRCPVTGRVCPD